MKINEIIEMRNTERVRIPGIVRIEVMGVGSLPAQVAYKRESGIPVEAAGWLTEIPFVGDALLEYAQESKRQPPMTTAELRFLTDRELPDGEWGWIATAANGERHLLGTREGLTPAVSVAESTGEADGDASRFEVTVRLTARFLPVKLGS